MEHEVKLRDGNTLVGRAKLRRINNNMCYLCAMEILPQFRGKGFYPKLRTMAMSQAKALGYRGWIFTVRPDNHTHFSRMVKRHGQPINVGAIKKHVAGLWHESFDGGLNESGLTVR